MMNQNKTGFLSSIPPVTKNIIIINFICAIAGLVLASKSIDLNDIGGLHPIQSSSFHLYQIVSYMFLHANLWSDPTHILFNMFAVYMFGRSLETIWGSKRFLIYYMVTGIGAGLIQLLVVYIRIHYVEASLSPDAVEMIYRDGLNLMSQGKMFRDPAMQTLCLLINEPVIGASGAVFGILLAFGMQFPNAELFIIPIPIPIKAKWLVIGYGSIELIQGIANRTGDNVAHFAHLGGLLFGIILILYWRKTNKINGGFH